MYAISRMRPIEIPTSKIKIKLLDAAEFQVAMRGFDSVSVRDITQLAKANVAAVNYHFGSREGMMKLLVARRLGPIYQKQLQNLNQLEKKRGSKAVPLEELLEAWVGPLFIEVSKENRKDEVLRHSVARMLTLPVNGLSDSLQDCGRELWKRYLSALGKCLKDVSIEELAWRLHILNGLAGQFLMGAESIEAWTGLGSGSALVEKRLSRLLRLAAPMMREGGIKGDDKEGTKGPQGIFDF